MASLEQLLQRVPQAPASANTNDTASFQQQSHFGQRSVPTNFAARRRSTSTTMSGSIPVPATSSMSAYHQRRTRDFLSRGRHSSSSSSSDEPDDDDANSALTGPGAPQSASYFRPRTFEDYTRYFEQQCMEGFLEKQSSEHPQLWKGRWFVMKDDKLFYYKRESDVQNKQPNDATVCGVIPLADIDSVTTAKDFGVATFQIRTQSRRFILRAESKDRMHDWLFNFQKSIANIISVLTRTQATEHQRTYRPSTSLSRRSFSRGNRSVSFDFQDNNDGYAPSVMDDFYRGRASGTGLDNCNSFGSDNGGNGGALSSSQSSSSQSSRRASSPNSFSSFGPRSPLATMFAFDPLDEVPEGVATHSALFNAANATFSDAYDPHSDDDRDHLDSSPRFFTAAAASPAIAQTLSPPVAATGRYIPPFMRNRMANASSSNSSGFYEMDATAHAASPPGGLASLASLLSPPTAPLAASGRWVPPNQREGFASSSTSRLSIDTVLPSPSTSFPPMTHHHHRESFADTFIFEESDSYSVGDAIHGVTSLIGVRKAMEDVCCCIPDLNAHFSDTTTEIKQSIYVLFDGHSGVRAAKFSEQRLVPYLRAHALFHTDARVAFEECFQLIDSEFLDKAAAENLSDGTTAAVVLIRGNRLLTANIGDSRAVASIGGQALDIIEEQTPGRVDERTRIEARGGWVREEKELHMSKLHSMDLSDPEIQQRANRVVQWVNIFRVNGELAVSRAIGDIDYKGAALAKYEYWAYPDGHDRVFTDDLVIAVPEFQEIEITPEFEFLVLACDGLWDTITSKEAVRHVSERLREGYTAQQASHSLANLAIRSGSSDNVSVVVVLLNPLRTLRA